MTRLVRLALLVLTLGAAAPTGTDGDPGAYRLRIPVTPGGTAPVQRLTLPPAALAAVRMRDLIDIRLFDARGRAVPMARAAAAPVDRRDALAAMPILGAADALRVNGMSLRIDPAGSARIARVDGTIVAGGDRSAMLGTLFDARAVTGVARTLTLDVAVPAAQPVTFTVEASRDLSAWRPLADKVVYRATGAETGPDVTIGLGDAVLAGDWLRVTWRLASRPLSPVAVRGAMLLSRPSGPAAIGWVAAVLPPDSDRRAIDVAVPFAIPIAALRIVPAGDDILVPVRILGRNDAEQPWTVIGEGVSARNGNGIVPDGGPYRMLRVAADPRSPGFTALPALHLGFATHDVMFLAAGPAPFTLAVGRPGAADAYLPLPALMTQAAGRPVGMAQAAAPPARMTLAGAGDAGRRTRQVVLWAVLLAATALLGALAWLSWRRRSPDGGPGAVGAAGTEAAPARFAHLRPGRRHRVVRAFVDHDGLTHPVGETWTFLRSEFLPYEDGLSLFVKPAEGPERQIRLQWRREAEGRIIDALHDHVLPVVDDAGGWTLLLTRDSVCMADDVEAPHADTLDIARDADAVAVAEAILAAGYPAWVGSNGTWSIEIGADRVVFGYRNGRRFVRPMGSGPATARAGDVDRLHLTYLAQTDPATL